MDIGKDWHPIFQFLFDLFKGLPPHFKYFFNEERNLVIAINSYLEDKKEMLIILERKKDWAKPRPGEMISIEEGWRLNFENGSVRCEQEIEFKSFTGRAIKRTKGETGACSLEEYNKRSWTWLGSQLNFLLKIIKESKRINPYTGKILSEKEAEEFDKKISVRMGQVEDFGVKVGEQLRKRV